MYPEINRAPNGDSDRVGFLFTWQHKDGSRVTGKVAAKINAPESDDIPWLLLTASSQSNHGVLANVTHIQRIHTHGGQPTGECKAATAGSEIRSQYSADYLFYTR